MSARKQKDPKRILRQATRLWSEAREGLMRTSPSNADPRALYVALLFARVLELYSGMLVLVGESKECAGRVVLRALLETAFKAAALARSPEAFDRYMDEGFMDERRILNVAKNTKGDLFDSLRGPEAESRLALAEQQIQERGASRTSALWYAEKAGLEDWYHSAWRHFSQATHGTVQDLECYYAHDETGRVAALRVTGSWIDSRRLLGIATVALLHSENALAEAFDLDLIGRQERYDSVIGQLLSPEDQHAAAKASN